MCGRFSLQNPERAYALFLRRAREGQWKPRYNIAPGETLAAVTASGDGERETMALFWGFRIGEPASATGPMVNARVETAAGKPSFRDSFHTRRCLLPADGFYEWRRSGGTPRPFHFTLREGQPFGLAGIWQAGNGSRPPAFCLLTTMANDLMKPIHHRMPVLLDEETANLWLSSPAKLACLDFLQRPFPSEQMEARVVAPPVNRAGNDGPECLAPWRGTDQTQLELF